MHGGNFQAPTSVTKLPMAVPFAYLAPSRPEADQSNDAAHCMLDSTLVAAQNDGIPYDPATATSQAQNSQLRAPDEPTHYFMTGWMPPAVSNKLRSSSVRLPRGEGSKRVPRRQKATAEKEMRAHNGYTTTTPGSRSQTATAQATHLTGIAEPYSSKDRGKNHEEAAKTPIKCYFYPKRLHKGGWTAKDHRRVCTGLRRVGILSDNAYATYAFLKMNGRVNLVLEDFVGDKQFGEQEKSLGKRLLAIHESMSDGVTVPSEVAEWTQFLTARRTVG